MTLLQNYTYHSLFNTNVTCFSKRTCILLQALNFGQPLQLLFLRSILHTDSNVPHYNYKDDHHHSQKQIQPPMPTFQHNCKFLLHILKCQWVVKVIKLLVQGIFNYLQFFSWLLANIINCKIQLQCIASHGY